jgi:hypothetical protein
MSSSWLVTIPKQLNHREFKNNNYDNTDNNNYSHNNNFGPRDNYSLFFVAIRRLTSYHHHFCIWKTWSDQFLSRWELRLSTTSNLLALAVRFLPSCIQAMSGSCCGSSRFMSFSGWMPVWYIEICHDRFISVLSISSNTFILSHCLTLNSSCSLKNS